jgi:hypothetical protein
LIFLILHAHLPPPSSPLRSLPGPGRTAGSYLTCGWPRPWRCCFSLFSVPGILLAPAFRFALGFGRAADDPGGVRYRKPVIRRCPQVSNEDSGGQHLITGFSVLRPALFGIVHGADCNPAHFSPPWSFHRAPPCCCFRTVLVFVPGVTTARLPPWPRTASETRGRGHCGSPRSDSGASAAHILCHAPPSLAPRRRFRRYAPGARNLALRAQTERSGGWRAGRCPAPYPFFSRSTDLQSRVFRKKA